MTQQKSKYAMAVIALVSILAMVAMGAFWEGRLTGAAKPTEGHGGGNPPNGDRGQPQLVRVFAVGSRLRNDRQKEFTGSVQARFENRISFRVPGKVARRRVEIGERVVPGQLLFEMDDGDYQLQQKSANASLQVARASAQQAVAEEKRLAELRRSNAVSQSEYERSLSDRDIALGRLDSAQKQLELADNQLAYCQLIADAAGIVISLNAEAGQVVSTGESICTIAQTSESEVVVELPENQLPQDHDLFVDVRFWSLPQLQVKARLRELSPTADPQTRTYRGRFTLINPAPEVQLGMTATVFWTESLIANSVSIPSTAVFRIDGQPCVWRICKELGSVESQPIELARFSDRTVTVSKGLRVGDQIVSAGVHKLMEGAFVRPWEEDGSE